VVEHREEFPRKVVMALSLAMFKKHFDYVLRCVV